jgi:hypothetical protein
VTLAHVERTWIWRDGEGMFGKAEMGVIHACSKVGRKN